MHDAVAGPPMSECAEMDGNLCTGQNPASATRLAALVLERTTVPEPAGPPPIEGMGAMAQQMAPRIGATPEQGRLR